MISSPGPRTPYPGAAGFHHAPNAALLIDFDNVTMGIRSDLGKELKSLLNSEVIRGKVAVQRAYADWRRYPQYIVPLAESSIDLIFAPAYGSAKKNATDLRMAIDAIELVFTRPEIGTFILMTGDSDFSSCVLKLKEYGKYVIGVGMRESSSDLLIQNCDEYYSYHSLSGLTRAGEVEDSKEDPWVLMKRAALQMEANGDVMRTDRLKQVMLDLDPAFDEKKIGYSKFSRFVQEAATKGVVRLRKGENGQYELVNTEADVEREPTAPSESRRGRGRDRDSRRDGRRDGRAPRPEVLEEKPAEAPAREEVVAEAAQVVSTPEAPSEPAVTLEPRGTPVVAEDGSGIDQAYSLLQAALRELTGGAGRSVRDGDVKRKMLDISPTFDESDLGFSKFTRFLRQAHDAEVIDLQRANGGNYEVALPASGKRLPAPGTGPAREARPAEEARPAATAAAPSAAPAPTAPARAPEAQRPAAETPAIAASAPPAPTVATPRASPGGVGALRGRRGGRPGATEGPPPILPGQVIAPAAAAPPARAEAVAVEPTVAAATTSPELPEAVEEPRKKSRRGRRGRGKARGGEGETAASPEAAQAAEPEQPATPAGKPADTRRKAATPPPEGPIDKATARARRGRAVRRDSERPDEVPPILPGQAAELPAAPAEAPKQQEATMAEAAPKKKSRSRGRPAARKAAAPAAPAAALAGLPRDRDAVIAYLTNSYRGVGQKTAEALFDAFGDNTFEVLQSEPDRVREVLGERRASGLLEQWSADYERRSAAAEPAPEPKKTGQATAGRGGRGRKKKEPAPSS